MILDTNAISAFADNDQRLLKMLPMDRPLYLPVVVIGEYRFGLQSSRERQQREDWLDQLIECSNVLEITLATAAFYSKVRADLKVGNVKIPPNDSWIAALALQHQLPILTRDAHFDRLEGIRRVGW